MNRHGLALALSFVVFGIGQTHGQEAEGPRLWAVVASVEDYAAPIPRRPGPNADGKRLARWISEKAGWPEGQVLELNDDGRPRPGKNVQAIAQPLVATSENLDWATDQWLRARVRPGDVVLLSFSGRGGVLGKDERLLPADFKPGEPGWSPEKAIARLLGESQCSAVLCWVDAPMLDPKAPAEPRPEAGDQILGRLARWPGATAWVATAEVTRPPAVGGPAAAPSGDAFASALRSALGDGRRPLLASLRELDADPRVRPLRFRQLGGVPAGLSLARDQFAAPRARRADLLVQKGHSAKVASVAIQGDGRSLITASDDSSIRIWDPEARGRELLRALPGFLNGVSAMALSADGRHLAAGDGMGKVLAWDLASSNPSPIALGEAWPHRTEIKAIAFLPPSRAASPGKAPSPRFVTIGVDGRCESWEINGRALAHRAIPEPRAKDLLLAVASDPAGPLALAILGEDSILHAFDRSLKARGDGIKLAGATPTALQVDPEGRRAVVGDEDGRVRVVRLADGEVVAGWGPFAGPVTALRVGPGGLAAIGSADGVHLVGLDRPGAMTRLAAGKGPVKFVEIAPDGRWLAAGNESGELYAWRLAEGRDPEAVPLDRPDGAPPEASCIAFGPPSGRPLLVAGEADGGVRRWDLEARTAWPRIAPHRGQVRQISATRDGRHLLQILEDDTAQLWDLEQGRGVRTLEGRWISGTFLPQGRLVLAGHANEGGGLTVLDFAARKAPKVVLAAPEGYRGVFRRLVASKDGRRVAATSDPGRDEFACVWDLPAGPPRVFGGHSKSLTAVDFSDDGASLLTAAEDGQVKLWDLDAAGGPAPSKREVSAPQVNAITAARFGPGRSGRVLAAGLSPSEDGLILYWDGKAAPGNAPGVFKEIGRTKGRVLAVAFLAEGHYIAAAGRDGQILAWRLGEGRSPQRVVVDPNPGKLAAGGLAHHTESINDLLAWPQPGGPTLASASADSTVRFWKLQDDARPDQAALELLGTLSSAPENVPAGPAPPASPVAPWVAFTPRGVYDASLDGEQLVSFSDGRSVEPLDQYAPRLYHPLLTDEIRRGVQVAPRSVSPPPPILIEAPGERGPAVAEVEIKVSLGSGALKAKDLRLYLNDRPVRSGDGFREASPGEYVATVSLARGENRLYAMASREEDADARSRDLVIVRDAPRSPGRLHVISVGVGGYRRNALAFPVDDARDFAEFVQEHGVGAGAAVGERAFLTDDAVSDRAVNRAFEKIRRAVKGHPEDTVVVFLAGHADILAGPKGRPTYSLLLPKFPFPDNAPALVAARGAGVAGARVEAPEGTYLPYATIYRNFADLDALQRLVIVDACQAEAVLDDPGVRLLDQVKAMDRETRQSRTNYFFASRRGEAAGEAKVLNHGLLTYVMLRGMGAPKLAAPPQEVAEFRETPSADLDGNGVISTRELHAYVDRILPALADHLAVASRGPEPAGPPARPKFAGPRVEASGPSFPLVVPPPAGVAGLRVGAETP